MRSLQPKEVPARPNQLAEKDLELNIARLNLCVSMPKNGAYSPGTASH